RLLMFAALGLVINAVIFLLVAFTGWVWLYLAAVPFSLLHLVGLIITLQVDRTPYSPGASDNASAVATVLTLAEHLVRQPLRHTELWFLFSGCEEVGCYGMRAFIEANRDELGDALFIDYEMVAQGEPGILTHEGLLTRVAYDPELIQLAADAAAAAWRPAHFKIGEAYGESVISHNAGYRSITVNAMLPETGEPVAWHRPDDDMRVVDQATLGHVVAWGLEILRRIDDS
ncbi:MAG TPA: M20/M25/M40 family metallo-hydrolase, partial [Anaerolineae bacterium]